MTERVKRRESRNFNSSHKGSFKPLDFLEKDKLNIKAFLKKRKISQEKVKKEEDKFSIVSETLKKKTEFFLESLSSILKKSRKNNIQNINTKK